jgi:hypothetical protein
VGLRPRDGGLRRNDRRRAPGQGRGLPHRAAHQHLAQR